MMEDVHNTSDQFFKVKPIQKLFLLIVAATLVVYSLLNLPTYTQFFIAIHRGDVEAFLPIGFGGLGVLLLGCCVILLTLFRCGLNYFESSNVKQFNKKFSFIIIPVSCALLFYDAEISTYVTNKIVLQKTYQICNVMSPDSIKTKNVVFGYTFKSDKTACKEVSENTENSIERKPISFSNDFSTISSCEEQLKVLRTEYMVYTCECKNKDVSLEHCSEIKIKAEAK